MTENVMLSCGHAAHALKALPDGSQVPSCVICDCEEQVTAPDLTGRRAKCSYRCGNSEPSAIDLPFFEYLGVGSPKSFDECVCGYRKIAHYPRWVAKIRVVRRWFKIERNESVERRDFHAPPELKEMAAERAADFFRSMMHDKHDENTRVFSVEVIGIEQIKNPLKCKGFTAKGAQEFDAYYCGCKGWN